MPRPVVTAFTEAYYARLPEAVRAPDEALGWPLLRYLSLSCDVAAPIGVLLDRLDPAAPPLVPGQPLARTPISELVDPAHADPEWLPWLGQFIGALSAPGVVLSRSALAATSWRHGSNEALERAVRAVLTAGASGARFVQVSPDPKNPWLIHVDTYAAQTPSADAVLAAALLERPEGFGLSITVRPGLTWAELRTLSTRPTWASAKAAGLRWADLTRLLPDGY